MRASSPIHGSAPSKRLRSIASSRAKAEGKRRFVLGGGPRGEDGVFQYKASFAPEGLVPFCAGRRVLRPDLYARLVDNRRALAARRGKTWEPSGFFPEYRG